MAKKLDVKKAIGMMCSLFLLMTLMACGTVIKHVPSQSLNELSIDKPTTIVVADVGDGRQGEVFDKIGQGVSYWLPVSFYAQDQSGRQMPVSFFIAASLCEDLRKVGYDANLVDDSITRGPLKRDEAVSFARSKEADYLITTYVTEGKSNFWGFLLIPFFEPVWTKIEYHSELIDLKDGDNSTKFKTYKKDTEWYFAKVTVLDAIFDAGLFGKHWHRTAWGETVISDALAETTQKISAEIQSKSIVQSSELVSPK